MIIPGTEDSRFRVRITLERDENIRNARYYLICLYSFVEKHLGNPKAVLWLLPPLLLLRLSSC